MKLFTFLVSSCKASKPAIKQPYNLQISDKKLERLLCLSRYTLAIIFIGSGLIPLVLSDSVLRLALLDYLPIPISMHVPLFYGLVIMDILCGIWVLLRPSRLILLILMTVVIGYTVVMTIFTPEIWQDPFSGMLKNIAIITLCWMTYLLIPEANDVS